MVSYKKKINFLKACLVFLMKVNGSLYINDIYHTTFYMTLVMLYCYYFNLRDIKRRKYLLHLCIRNEVPREWTR